MSTILEISVKRPNWYRNAETTMVMAKARTTDTPGLAITKNIQVYGPDIVEEKGWLLVHIGSGKLVRRRPFRTLALARKMAGTLRQLGSWKRLWYVIMADLEKSRLKDHLVNSE